ncbi:MAG: hypothetical protein RRC07_13565 [Anaerolineae bacterium]|nr:hypothetical protein [Anaerolineae bacterium]
MQKSSLTWFSLLFMLLFLPSCRNRRPDPVALVNDYAERANAHDIPAIMELFVEDAQFELVGQGTLPDLAAIQAIHEYDKGINTTITFHDCSVDGLRATCQASEQNDWLKAAGLDGITYSSTVFTFTEAGRIQRIAATTSPDDGAAMGSVLAEFIPWLLAERPERSAALFDANGQFVYSEANGSLVVELLREWRAGR